MYVTLERGPTKPDSELGHGCVDQIFSLRYVLEIRHGYQQPMAVCFIDFVAAFDSVHRESLWRKRELDGVPPKIIPLIKVFYRSTNARVLVLNKFYQPFDTRSGIRQSGILSPFYSRTHGSVQFTPGHQVTDLDYAEYIDWLASSFVKNVSEAVSRLFVPLGVVVAHRPEATIRRQIMRPKDPLPQQETSGVVYRIWCNCEQSDYVGETGRLHRARIAEHVAAVRRNDANSEFTAHLVRAGHKFKFDDAELLARGVETQLGQSNRPLAERSGEHIFLTPAPMSHMAEQPSRHPLTRVTKFQRITTRILDIKQLPHQSVVVIAEGGALCANSTEGQKHIAASRTTKGQNSTTISAFSWLTDTLVTSSSATGRPNQDKILVTEQPKVWRALPYIDDVSEAVSRLLRPLGIGIAHRPDSTIQNLAMRPKAPLPRGMTANVIYRIKCDSSEVNYVEETEKRLQTRVIEHLRAVRRKDPLSLVAEHCANSGHTFAFQNAEILTRENDRVTRETIKALHTQTASINRCVALPAVYQALRAQLIQRKRKYEIKPNGNPTMGEPRTDMHVNMPQYGADEGAAINTAASTTTRTDEGHVVRHKQD
ncbi:unnamed protein product [Schistocephalus solidus]|uniref:Uncharacterized protein n=1 Tax=Schistocephalus solidus TaxID=70667 RepID=A0A3P7EFN6_SCHSO|nr:unnamed protein product [Schistocephalus solidus]